MLEKNTTTIEVKNAIKSSKNGTAPGIDGISYKFFKFWLKKYEEYKDKENDSTVKKVKDITEILVRVYNEIENEELYNDNFVLGTMNLLYKKKNKQRIKNYRPITLTNTDYKIYMKMIAEKLGKIAHKIIHPNQAGFIPGRNIHDHTRLTRSMIHYCETHQKNGYVLSLDQEKAYDKIVHDYLWKSLEKYGFPQKFIQKIQKLYKKAKTIVSINKTLLQAIKIDRGVRQDCPMSCLLYDIAIEPLAETIQKTNLREFRIQGIEERILVLMFADDTMIYMNENDNTKPLEDSIKRFCEVSTAKFNEEKSEILPMGTKKYRDDVVKTRVTNQANGRLIDPKIKIVGDRESM